MKIAVFADLHLTDNFGTVKNEVFEWALTEVRRRQADLLCLIGDLTAQGTAHQADRILDRIAKVGIPWCSTPGNAELRSGVAETEKRFDLPAPGSAGIVTINTARNEPDPDELAKLSVLPDGAGFLLATHNPVRNWSEAARAVVREAEQRRAITAVIAGHSHHDEPGILRGLDPDKASGGPPMFSILSRGADGWKREDVVMPGVDPAEWPEADRAALRRMIGISTMWEPLDGLDFACRNRIAHVELRFPLNGAESLTVPLARWRENGGRTLSLHLPSLTPGDDGGKLLQAAECAVRLHCDRVTLHVPKVTAADFPARREQLLERFAAGLGPVLKNGLTIGIENLHTCPDARTDDRRNYGCTIAECRAWIELLRERFAPAEIGFHMDIGHARNNAPFSGRENLSDYYCELGRMVNGWHFHQVVQSKDGFLNHQKLTGFYDKLISLGGWFMARRNGQLADAPVFLEVRDMEENKGSYLRLTELLDRGH
ncbi:MAG: metallophosphoesterase family protein [Lentisphaeria bacterium]|nr:metallophosphoesterase family protein [Lentisphaeria bacterium]